MNHVDIKFRVKEGCEDLPLPQYMSEAASGMDLYAAVDEDVVLKNSEIKLIPTGIFMSMPPGYEAQVRPRSGLALKHGLTIVNSPGTIDSDYRGEICIIIGKVGGEPLTITRAMRIAQLVVQPVCRANVEVVAELDETARNTGGFGHTGTH